MKIEAQVFTLKNKSTFTIATGSRTETKTVLVKITNANGFGLGEATPVPYYGVSPEETANLINSLSNQLNKTELLEPASFYQKIEPQLRGNSFALCALDLAFYDLWAKTQGLPLYEALGLKLKNMPLSNYTIGIDEPKNMLNKMKEVDFPIYKIKLGTPNDIEIIRTLRKSTNAVFRVDANTGWSPQETLKNAKVFENLGVEFIEQPLKADQFAEMAKIKNQSSMKFMADESCILPEDIKKCFGAFDAVNIKLAKCGGITPALKMIKQARNLGLEVMMGCMTESSVGISAIAHLLPLLDYVDLDGALLISNDPANGVNVSKGKTIFTNRPGTGALLNE